MDAYRHAVRAAAFLRGCLHGPWLKEVRAQALEDGDAQVLVVILREDVMVRRCVPTSVDSIPVAVVVDGEGSR